MVSLADHFRESRYKRKYAFMTRVMGTYGVDKIPFAGSVGNDTVISEADGPILHILLDLPLLIDGEIHNVLTCKHRDVRVLKELK